MRLIIVTGMSGAGKSVALDALEDLGMYCMDNIPPALIPKIARLGSMNREESGIDSMAMVVDARGLQGHLAGKDTLKEMLEALSIMDQEKIPYQILFLDAANEELINRYKITRRPHPLMKRSDSLARAIQQERELLQKIRERADLVLDTTMLSVSQLKNTVKELFRDSGSAKPGFVVNCISFGFKFGVPADADLLFDVRCLPNPFYDPQLRTKTGLDREVREYVLDSDKTQGFLQRLYDFIDYMIPLYRDDEGKSQLMIGVGCTGGKHRSVTVALELSQHLREKGIHVVTGHRDIERKKL